MSSENKDQHESSEIENEIDENARLEQLAMDTSDPSDAASILRENAQLVLDIQATRQRMFRVWMIVGILAFGYAATMFIWLTSFPKIAYIETRNNEPICTLTTASEAYLSSASLTDYAKEAALSSYTFDYLNYNTLITRAADTYFTASGRAAYLRTLDTSGNLERVIKGRLTLRSYVSRAPQLEEQGMMDATTRYWVVTVPIVIEFYAGGLETPRSRQDFLATVTLVSVRPSAANLKGIGVDSMVLKPYTPPRR